MPHISPEAKYHVKNDRRTHGKQGSVNKILADPGCRNAHPVADRRTNAKRIPLNKTFEFVHSANLKNPL
jgi:hypothetical protein